MIFFVTGGSRGIGASVVLQAVREGHDVAFTYLGHEEGARAVAQQASTLREGAHVGCYQLDVRDPDQVEQVGNQVLDDFDTVDVVVNNAAVNKNNLAVSMSDEEWLDVIATNLSGPFFVSRFFLTTMLANRFGRIINISSMVARGASGQANYAASKSGLVGLTRTLAKEYGPKGITANLVVPGYFETEMTRSTMTEQFHDHWLGACPLRRIGELDEICKLITFLSTDAAGFITGAEIPVTGGLDEAL